MNPICALANYFDERYIIIIFCSHMRRFYFHSRIPIIVSFFGVVLQNDVVIHTGDYEFPVSVNHAPFFIPILYTGTSITEPPDVFIGKIEWNDGVIVQIYSTISTILLCNRNAIYCLHSRSMNTE